MTAEDEASREAAIDWARKTIERAVQTFLDQGVLDSPVVETKPSWGLSPDVLIAMLREQGAQAHAYWLICGAAVPFGYLPASAARTPREAARHFALNWQLKAARLRDSADSRMTEQSRPGTGPAAAAHLERQAEWLYRLVDDDSLWQSEMLQS